MASSGSKRPREEEEPMDLRIEKKAKSSSPSDIFNQFFEGPEKLLEIWFLSEDASLQKGRTGLRCASRQKVEEMLDVVQCKILSSIHNDFFDAYLLSESSLFVFPTKVVLKTCGTTTLLLAVPHILEMAKAQGLKFVGDIFYSRRKYVHEHFQKAPQGSFADEIAFIKQWFDGAPFILGPIDFEPWYLYTTDKPKYHIIEDVENWDNKQKRSAPLPSKLLTEGPAAFTAPHPPDFTLELLMTGLPAHVCELFYGGGETQGELPTLEEAKKLKEEGRIFSERMGINSLVPGADVDARLFAPCGYSSNGMHNSGYFTIHVTPQEICSYASFETNIKPENFGKMVTDVLAIFKPSSFTVTLFAGHTDVFEKECTTITSALGAYDEQSNASYKFRNGYQLFFAHFLEQPTALS